MKLVDRMLTKHPMQMLDMKETIDQLAKAHSVHWHGYALRKDRNNFLKIALDLRVKDTRKRADQRKPD